MNDSVDLFIENFHSNKINYLFTKNIQTQDSGKSEREVAGVHQLSDGFDYRNHFDLSLEAAWIPGQLCSQSTICCDSSGRHIAVVPSSAASLRTDPSLVSGKQEAVFVHSFIFGVVRHDSLAGI